MAFSISTATIVAAHPGRKPCASVPGAPSDPARQEPQAPARHRRPRWPSWRPLLWFTGEPIAGPTILLARQLFDGVACLLSRGSAARVVCGSQPCSRPNAAISRPALAFSSRTRRFVLVGARRAGRPAGVPFSVDLGLLGLGFVATAHLRVWPRAYPQALHRGELGRGRAWRQMGGGSPPCRTPIAMLRCAPKSSRSWRVSNYRLKSSACRAVPDYRDG
jgi:hypothetical protein